MARAGPEMRGQASRRRASHASPFPCATALPTRAHSCSCPAPSAAVIYSSLQTTAWVDIPRPCTLLCPLYLPSPCPAHLPAASVDFHAGAVHKHTQVQRLAGPHGQRATHAPQLLRRRRRAGRAFAALLALRPNRQDGSIRPAGPFRWCQYTYFPLQRPEQLLRPLPAVTTPLARATCLLHSPPPQG